MPSVIIPAHNEAAVLGRCLDALLSGAHPEDLEVIVVCNGCTDRTGEVARSFGGEIKVIETAIPSKSNALNLGDAAATRFPRIYLDADIVLSRGAVTEVAAALQDGTTLAAAPRMVVDYTARPLLVRAFYETWITLPYFANGTMIGTGIYAISEEGRRRFERFPDIIADDGFVRLLFAPHERRTVQSCTFTITPPRRLRDIVQVKTRVRAGYFELRQKFPQLWINDDSGGGRSLWRMLRRPRLGQLVYVLVTLEAKRRGRAKLRRGLQREWERDESSRITVPAQV